MGCRGPASGRYDYWGQVMGGQSAFHIQSDLPVGLSTLSSSVRRGLKNELYNTHQVGQTKLTHEIEIKPPVEDLNSG